MVVVSNSTVQREDMTTVMEGSVNDTGAVPLCGEAISPTSAGIPAGSNVCSVLQCSSDGRVCPSAVQTRERQVRDFIPVVGQFAIK